MCTTTAASSEDLLARALSRLDGGKKQAKPQEPAGAEGQKEKPAPEAFAFMRRCRGSVAKYRPYLSVLYGLPVQEAMDKTMLWESRYKSLKVRAAVKSATANAVENAGAARDRLYVAEIYATKAMYLPRINMHGKGRAGRKHKHFCHLFARVKEQPLPPEGVVEKRIGFIKNSRTTLEIRLQNEWAEERERRRIQLYQEHGLEDLLPTRSSSSSSTPASSPTP